MQQLNESFLSLQMAIYQGAEKGKVLEMLMAFKCEVDALIDNERQSLVEEEELQQEIPLEQPQTTTRMIPYAVQYKRIVEVEGFGKIDTGCIGWLCWDDNIEHHLEAAEIIDNYKDRHNASMRRFGRCVREYLLNQSVSSEHVRLVANSEQAKGKVIYFEPDFLGDNILEAVKYADSKL